MTCWAKNRIAVLALFLVLTFCASCTARNPVQKEFGADADYFIGLTQLKNGLENEARSKFYNCIKKGTAQCVRKSYEALCTFGSVQEKNQAVLNYVEKYQDSDAILTAVRQLKSAGEISRIIELTENCSLREENNEILKIRMESLVQRGDSSLENEVFVWFTERPLSSEHYQFYRDSYSHPVFSYSADSLEHSAFTPRQFALNYRIALYKRDYSYTFTALPQLMEYFDDGTLEPSAQLASDMGKTCLYGDTDFARNASRFSRLAEKYKETPMEYYFWFYAGRLFDKASLYIRQTKLCFEKAAGTSQNASQKDNALWYLLVSSMNSSLDSAADDIQTCSRLWDNPEYFEDFFESLISGLLAAGKWDLFGKIYKIIDGYATDLSVSQYAYLYGRLIQEKLAAGTERDAQDAFRRALNSGTSAYYKAMSAYQLGLGGAELAAVLTAPFSSADAQKIANPDFDAETLLKGYAYFGFPERIYPTWQRLYKNGISDETSFFLADFLNRCSTGTDDYFQQALRIASRTAAGRTLPFTNEQLAQLYPRNYSAHIQEFSERYEIEPSVVYAMVRSESFFDPDVQSSAGAIGLTQLMEFTGGDIARKLKVQNYDLTDPEVNLQFGTYYLAELVRRCDGSMLQGFFSYNAGITRVRRWVQSSMIEFGKKENMPSDLFLETVPFAETREYGRKLAGAAVMYEWIYSDDPDGSFNEIIKKLMK